jgi:hypothetical protein
MASQVKNQMIIEANSDFVRVKHVVSGVNLTGLL